MKKIIITFSLLISLSAAAFAQCDKTIVLNSSKTDHLDANGAVTRTQDENAEVTISKTAVDIRINDNPVMTGTITANSCDWKVPFKEGKSVISATMSNSSGEDKKVTITIEGKNGKVLLMFEVEGESGDKIKVQPDKFAEKA